MLSNIGEAERQGHRQDRNTLRMRPALIDFAECYEYDIACTDGKHKEQRRAEYHLRDRLGRVLQADDECQDENADDVIDDGRTHDRLTDLCRELSQLLKRLYRNADTGGGQDGADKNAAVELLRSGR